MQRRPEEALDDRRGVLIRDQEVAQRTEYGVVREPTAPSRQQLCSRWRETDALALERLETCDLAIERRYGLGRARDVGATSRVRRLCGLQRGAGGRLGRRRLLGRLGRDRELLGRHFELATYRLSAIAQRFALGVERTHPIAHLAVLTLRRRLFDRQPSHAIAQRPQLALFALDRLARANDPAARRFLGRRDLGQAGGVARDILLGRGPIGIGLIALGPDTFVERDPIAPLVLGTLATRRRVALALFRDGDLGASLGHALPELG